MTVTLAEDHHVHSSFSDDAVSSVAANVAVARQRGLTVLCLTDHVRAGTRWVPELVRTVRATRAGELRLRCGVEAKLLDSTGRLDLPDPLPRLDRILIADHQYPGDGGPIPPAGVQQRLTDGRLTPEQVIDTLVQATIRALHRTPMPQLAHLFSLLPKVGLAQRSVGDDHLAALAAAARDTGAVVEVNDKWGCPGPRALGVFAAAGVPVVAGTDSHQAGDVGSYHRVQDLTQGLADGEGGQP